MHLGGGEASTRRCHVEATRRRALCSIGFGSSFSLVLSGEEWTWTGAGLAGEAIKWAQTVITYAKGRGKGRNLGRHRFWTIFQN
jgi:hypothetical protein